MTGADERDAFYQAIMDKWDDDTPRLVYADWLDERGDEPSCIRAEFIRLDCELARHTDPRRIPKKLQQRHDRARTGLYRDLSNRDIPTGNMHFARGFPRYLIAPLECYVESASACWDELGPIEDPELYGCIETSPVFGEVAQLPALRHWRGLSFSSETRGDIGGANFAALIASPHLTNLRSVTITEQTRMRDGGPGTPLGANALSATSHNPALTRLSSIRIWWSGITDSALLRFGKGRFLPNLRKLSLADEFTDAGIAALAKSPVLETVEHLHLNGRLSGESLKHIMTSPRLKSLHTLDLSVWTSGTHEHDSLTRLDGNQVYDKMGVEAFASSPLLPQLKVVKLSGGEITARNAAKLAEAAQRLTSLERLSIIGNLGRLDEACQAQRGNALKIEEVYFDPE